MKLNQIRWKEVAMVLGLLLLCTCFSNFLSYYQKRYLFTSPLIPEWVLIMIAKPYLISGVVLAICSLPVAGLYYLKKYKISAIVSIVAFIFDFINLEIIGESWTSIPK